MLGFALDVSDGVGRTVEFLDVVGEQADASTDACTTQQAVDKTDSSEQHRRKYECANNAADQVQIVLSNPGCV